MNNGERGFKGILLSSIFGQCRIPFQCSPHPVSFNTDGKQYYIEIVDGYGRFADIEGYSTNRLSSLTDTQNTEISLSEGDQNESSTSQFKFTINAINDSIEGTDDKSIIFNISCILDHFRVVCMALYDSPVTSINLTFGVEGDEGEKIHLLDGNVKTTPNTYVSYLFKDVPGGEETFIDYFVSAVLYDPSNDTESNTSPYQFSHQNDISETETIASFEYSQNKTEIKMNSISQTGIESIRRKKKKSSRKHLSARVYNTATLKYAYENYGRCYSNFEDCLEGKYKCPLLYVIYYFARHEFPQVDQDKLYTLLKIRLIKTGANKDVNVCVRCVHIYLDEKRDHQIVKSEKDYLYKKSIPSYDGCLFIKKPPSFTDYQNVRKSYSKKTPLSVKRMADGKPAHRNSRQIELRTKNEQEWNEFYDNLTRKKSKSVSLGKSFNSNDAFPSEMKVKSSKKINLPAFQQNESMALKKAPSLYSIHNLARKSWDPENIVRRFIKKSYKISDPQYIEPRDCHITEI